MTEKIHIHRELADAISEVISELATELDLYYEDSDIVAAGPAIVKMKRLVAMLLADDHPVPDEYVHIVGRYNRARN